MPATATNKNLIWSVEPEGIVILDEFFEPDETCNVYPLRVGTAVVTATSEADPTKFATCTVTVNHGSDEDIPVG